MLAIKRTREEIDAFIRQLQSEKLSVIDRAICTATYAHSGAVRKGTAVPYILHPLEAAAIVTQVIAEQRGTAPDAMTPSDNFIIAAAILHDTVEDTELTAEDIKTIRPRNRSPRSRRDRKQTRITPGSRNMEAAQNRIHKTPRSRFRGR